MDFKKIKANTEKNIVTMIKSLVNKDIEVQASYSIEKNTVAILLVNEIKNEKNDKITERMIVYSCSYGVDNGSLDVTGFTRVYYYDGFGIARVDNEPVTIQDAFIDGIKGAVKAGLTMPTDEPEAPAETSEEGK